MKILMKQTQKGSRNGIVVENFESGKVYDLSDAQELAATFISLKWAEPAGNVTAPVFVKPVEVTTEQHEEPVKAVDLDALSALELKEHASKLGIDPKLYHKKKDLIVAIKEITNV